MVGVLKRTEPFRLGVVVLTDCGETGGNGKRLCKGEVVLSVEKSNEMLSFFSC